MAAALILDAPGEKDALALYEIREGSIHVSCWLDGSTGT